ncbi:DUF1648 domain-containing protein [Sphingomonas sp. MMS24-J13]|uniref:DUF1648 domain-containing protein n=1 Tax=Sphingomonas sp. MMS24-J13 TaxID=3238686 RepID=UPI00384D22B2
MRTKGLLAVSGLLIGGLALTAVVAGQALPPDVRLPMHWNAAGEVDGWGSKWAALLAPVALGIIIPAILAGAGRFVPRGDAMERSAGLVRIAWLGTIGLAWTIELMVLAVAFRWPVAPVRMLLIAMGLFLAALGNQFGKSRPMWLIGIRTPWTMDDPDVWIATHRLGENCSSWRGRSGSPPACSAFTDGMWCPCSWRSCSWRLSSLSSGPTCCGVGQRVPGGVRIAIRWRDRCFYCSGRANRPAPTSIR